LARADPLFVSSPDSSTVTGRAKRLLFQKPRFLPYSYPTFTLLSPYPTVITGFGLKLDPSASIPLWQKLGLESSTRAAPRVFSKVAVFTPDLPWIHPGFALHHEWK